MIGALLICWASIASFSVSQNIDGQDYIKYHKQVLRAEELIAAENYKEALLTFETLFSDYEFIFLREYQIATQLASYLGHKQKALDYLKKGISSGWTLKAIKKHKFITKRFDQKDWLFVKQNYASLRQRYEASINSPLRKQVKKMYSKDQWRAFKALFKFTSKGKNRYAEKKFVPHSEQQMASLMRILQRHGYPGERLIGNDFWMSTIMSHHNSITKNYAQRDTIYPNLKAEFLNEIGKGQMSPYEFIVIDEWHRTVLDKTGYGILNKPKASEVDDINKNRAIIFVRSIRLRNQLVDIEKRIGFDLFLKGRPWYGNKIIIEVDKN